jgi:hypothetical protein
MLNFSINVPFVFDSLSEMYKNNVVSVLCRECGLQRIYQGRLTKIDEEKTKVGDEVIMNECIRQVKIDKRF